MDVLMFNVAANFYYNQIAKMCAGRSDEMTCLLEKRQEIESSEDGGLCKRYLKSMAAVFFSDYHLISGFVDKCSEDVKRLNCGVISPAIDEKTTSQVCCRVYHL